MGIVSKSKSIISKIVVTAKKIGPAIQQGGTYGETTNVGGKEVKPTGPTVTTTGTITPSKNVVTTITKGGGGSSGTTGGGGGLLIPSGSIKEQGLKEPIYDSGLLIQPSEKTIAQQIKTAPPKTISPYNPNLKEDYKSTGLTGWEATKASIKNIPSGFKQSVSGLITEVSPSEGLNYIFSPFKRYGKPKEEKEIIIPEMPWRGTKIEKGFLPLGMEGFKGTYGELAEKRRIEYGIIEPTEEFGFIKLSSDIQKRYEEELTLKYQGKIAVGELTLEQAQKRYEKEFTKIYEKEYNLKSLELQQAYLRQPKDLHERTGAKISKYAPAVVETGALIGTSFKISPSFTPIGASVVYGYIFGRGFKSTIESPTMAGKALGVGTMGLGLAGYGFTMKGLQRSITLGEIEEAIAFNPSGFAKPTKSLKFSLSPTESLEYTPQVYRFGNAIVKKEVLIGSSYTKGVSYIKGIGNVKVFTSEYMTGKPVNYLAKTSFKGIGVPVKVAEKGILKIPTKDLFKNLKVSTEFEGFQPSIVSGKVSKEWELLTYGKRTRANIFTGYARPIEKINIGAISRRENNLIYSMSGDLKFPPKIKIGDLTITKEGTFGFNVEDIGITKVIQKPSERINIFGGKGFEGISKGKKTTPFSATFNEGSLELKQTIPSPSITSTSGLKEKLFKPVKVETKTSGLISISKTKVRLKENLGLSSVVLSAQSLQILQPQKNILSPSQKYKQAAIPISSFSVASALGQEQGQRQGNLLAISPAFASASKFRANPSPEFTGIFGGGLFIPSLGFAERRGKRKFQLSTRKTAYKPSLRSMVFNIKAPKIPKSYYLGAGDITSRPIIISVKKKHKT